jgi:hypothetical protein
MKPFFQEFFRQLTGYYSNRVTDLEGKGYYIIQYLKQTNYKPKRRKSSVQV